MRSWITLLVMFRLMCTTTAIATGEQPPVVIDRDNNTRRIELSASNDTSAFEELTDAWNITHVIFGSYYSFDDQDSLDNVTGGDDHRKSNDTAAWSLEALVVHNATIYPFLLVLSEDSQGVLEVAEGQAMPTLDIAGVGEPSSRELSLLTEIAEVREPTRKELRLLKKYGRPLKTLPTIAEETGQLPISVQQKDFPSSDIRDPRAPSVAREEAWMAESWEKAELRDALDDVRYEKSSMDSQIRLRNVQMEKATFGLPEWKEALARQAGYMSHLKQTNAA
ncbi:hypothetical protein LTR95_005216 [Oleoguttula sp. CCFEE 5521]